MSIRFPEPKAYMRFEETTAPPAMTLSKSGVTTQMDMLEHQLCVMDELLGTLNARLSPVLRPANVPVNSTREQEKVSRMNSALVESLSNLAQRMDLLNQRLMSTIEEVDL